jgi:hypothetical protein
MKIKQLVLASMIAGATLFGATAHAEEIGKTVSITLDADGTGGYAGYFGSTFAAVEQSNTFVDKFLFVLGSNFDSTASLTSTYLNKNTVKDLVITDYSLVKYDPTTDAVLASYSGVNTLGTGLNAKDGWDLTANSLTAGAYYIQVSGLVSGVSGGSYASDLNISVAAVPEPETYGMMVAGLGLLGFMARRRKNAKQA